MESKNAPKKNNIIKFFTIVLGSVGAFTLIFSAVILSFFIPENSRLDNFVTDIDGNISSVSPHILSTIFQVPSVPVRTSFVLYGIDDEHSGADVVILGAFNRITGEIDIINIPRDTFLTVTDTSASMFREAGRLFNRDTKITDMFGQAGRELAPKIVGNQIEEWLNITIDYYVVVDLSAFRAIVDLVGPIEMHVPRRLFYNDNAGLIIDIQPGLQMLDGRMAEGLVRYRSTYARGDIQRIEVQQEFLRILFNHIIELNLLSNVNMLTEIFRIILNNVDTDFSFDSVFGYIPHLSSIDINNLNIIMMPGDPSYTRRNARGENISFVRPYMDELLVIVNRIFHGIEVREEEETNITIALEN
ncbi:MAG: LCP family protein [Defluviitaleaceae bacterium]|nr:LCP family protein [Defluviitaleaceae bacterium]